MRRISKSFLLCLLLTVAALSGCTDRNILPGQFHDLTDARWHYGDTLFFTMPADTVDYPIEALLVGVRHSDRYPFSNLWMELSYFSDDSLVADTFNMVFADNYGKWYGVGSGPVRMVNDTVVPRAVPDPSTRFGLRHIMRLDVVPDIEQVGVTFLINKSRPL